MVVSLITWLLIGAIAGWLSSLIVKGHSLGLVGNIAVGIIGAVIAGWLLPLIGFVFIGGILATIANALIGAVLLLVIIGSSNRGLPKDRRALASSTIAPSALPASS